MGNGQQDPKEDEWTWEISGEVGAMVTPPAKDQSTG
jgi:hypothetical protein